VIKLFPSLTKTRNKLEYLFLANYFQPNMISAVKVEQNPNGHLSGAPLYERILIRQGRKDCPKQYYFYTTSVTLRLEWLSVANLFEAVFWYFCDNIFIILVKFSRTQGDININYPQISYNIGFSVETLAFLVDFKTANVLLCSSPLSMRVRPGNPYWKGRISTVGLLVSTSSEQISCFSYRN
jgi:hypothetical protein